MTAFLILIAALVFGALWGAVQGMIMIKPGDKMAAIRMVTPDCAGVRNHLWFKYYHRLCVFCLTAFAGLVILWVFNIPHGFLSIIHFLALTIGCALLSWEAAELMYSDTRYAKWICVRENVTLADFASTRLSMDKTIRLHVIRFCGGFILVTIAIFL